MSGGEIDRRTLIGAGLALAATPAIVRARTATALPEANCPAGTFMGEQTGRIISFRGIRYGRAQRFCAPTPEPRAQDLVFAYKYGAASPQSGRGAAGDEGIGTNEDCLFLNVWTTGKGTVPRPVMVYIHGGGYSGGSGSSPLYDGTQLAQRDVVVVTVNHRLNAFGYLYLARLDSRFPDSGNAGQLDLILALKWVRDNIAAFGGDPNRVMVFGQSGGGAKIATLMGTSAAKGLFHRAATMSGQQVTASGPMHATARARAYLAKLGVSERDLSPLLTMPAEKLVEGLSAIDPILGGGVYFGPVLDMKWLVRHPFWPDAHPQSLSIPMLLGNTHDETRAFISPDSDKVKGLSWDNLADRMAPELRIDVLPEWVVTEYRGQFPGWSPTDIFYAATTAGRSWRGQVIEAEERAKVGAPAWVYQVDFTSRTDPRRGAMHMMDIPLVFGTLGAPGSQTGTGADAGAASKAMQDSFVTFARTGNPNHADAQFWPTYDLTKRATMLFDTTSRVENDPRKWQRELFTRIPYIQPGT